MSTLIQQLENLMKFKTHANTKIRSNWHTIKKLLKRKEVCSTNCKCHTHTRAHTHCVMHLCACAQSICTKCSLENVCIAALNVIQNTCKAARSELLERSHCTHCTAEGVCACVCVKKIKENQ